MDTKRARTLLERERSELAALAGRVEESGDLDESQEESTGELTGLDQHLGDHASDTFEREKQQSIEAGLTTKLDEIDAALERIDSGEYGVCEVCGREIADERLEAVPATRYCRDHAEGAAEPDTSDADVEITQELEA